MAMMVYSHSRLNKYLICQWAFYLKYVKGVPEAPKEYKDFGKAVHKAIKHILRDKLSKAEAIIKALTKAEFRHDVKDIDRLIGSAILNLAGTVSPENVEQHFQVPLSDEEDAPQLQGDIDLSFSRNPAVVDWKAGWKIYNPTDDHQLGLYAWVKSLNTGAQEVLGELFFLRKNEARQHKYTAADMEEARKWAYHLAMEIEEKLLSLAVDGEDPESLFAKNTTSTACKTCDYAVECFKHSEQLSRHEGDESVPPAATAPGDVPRSLIEAQALAAEILRLENVLSEYKGYLQAFVKETKTPVQVGQEEFDFLPSVSWEFSPDKLKTFAQFLGKKGINPWANLSLGATNVTKLKKLGVTEEELKQYARQKVNHSFRKHKIEVKPEETIVEEGAA